MRQRTRNDPSSKESSMPPKSVPVPVHVNFHGISYDSATGQWTIPADAPRWTVPPTVAVSSGHNLITWTLTTSNVPSGFSPEFDIDDAIVFNAGWPGGSPIVTSDATVECTDNFEAGPNNPEYYYSITVDLQQTSGTVSQPFTLDPDIKNQGANPVICYVVSGAAIGQP
jgi:hypothetical protein